MPRTSLTLELRAVSHAHDGAPALRDFSLTFAPATFNLLAGDSGLAEVLLIAGLRALPDAGDVLLGGKSTRDLDDNARADLRSRRFGYLFPAPYLLPAMTIVENVAMPLFKISGAGLDEARDRTNEVLEFTGLTGGERISVGELTPAEQQRVALARGLVHRPAFVLVEHADASLTDGESARFIEMLREVPARFHATVIAALSAPIVATKRERVIAVRDGAVCGDSLCLPASESSRS